MNIKEMKKNKPEPKEFEIHIRLGKKPYKRLKAIEHASGLSFSEVVRVTLETALK